jgi:hypothetical protein
MQPGSGKSARAVLLERVGGKNVGRWWLRKEVDIPATHYARDAFRATKAEVPSVLQDALDVAYETPGSTVLGDALDVAYETPGSIAGDGR